MDDRKKTTVMLPHEINLRVEEWSKRLGIGKNGFIALATAKFVVEMVGLETLPKRQTIVQEMEKQIQTLLESAREAT